MDYLSYEEERAQALDQDAMPQGEYIACALGQFAAAHGAERPGSAWILTPFDTWVRNPFYKGPPVRHPEDDGGEQAD